MTASSRAYARADRVDSGANDDRQQAEGAQQQPAPPGELLQFRLSDPGSPRGWATAGPSPRHSARSLPPRDSASFTVTATRSVSARGATADSHLALEVLRTCDQGAQPFGPSGPEERHQPVLPDAGCPARVERLPALLCCEPRHRFGQRERRSFRIPVHAEPGCRFLRVHVIGGLRQPPVPATQQVVEVGGFLGQILPAAEPGKHIAAGPAGDEAGRETAGGGLAIRGKFGVGAERRDRAGRPSADCAQSAAARRPESTGRRERVRG